MQKKMILITLTLILSLLFGVGLVVYPLFSNWYTDQVQSSVQAEYDQVLENVQDSDLQKALEAARKYNEALFNCLQSGAESPAAPYNGLLNLSGNGIMGYVEIPAIQVSLPIYHGCSDTQLQKGAGHMPGTSLPVGGESTHAVISAHSGMASAKMFTDLDKLSEGDRIFLHVLGETLAYEVDQITVTVPSDTRAIQITAGDDLLTLLTCTPYGVNTHRLLVRGRRTALPEVATVTEEAPIEPHASTWMQKYLQGIELGALAVIFIILFVLFVFRLVYRSNR